jgi:hypothetical protein
MVMCTEFLSGKLFGNGKDVRMVLRSISEKLVMRRTELVEDCVDGRFLYSWCSISRLCLQRISLS